MTKSLGVNRNKTMSLQCAAEAIVEGLVYKYDGTYGYMTVTTAATDAAFAIGAQSSMDWELNTARTLTAYDNWQFFVLGCQEIVNVQSANSIEWDPGDIAYLTTSGRISSVDGGSAKVIGHYKGPEITTSSAGQLVQIILDTASAVTSGAT